MSFEAPATRIVVLVAVALACGGAAVALLLVRSARSAGTPAPHIVTTLHHAVGAPKAVGTPKVVPLVHRPKIVRPTLLAGLPGPIAYVLERHPSVVVALYEHGTGGAAALAEARAGAARAHTPFVAIDVLRPRFAGSIAGFTGSLAAPSVIVVRRPGVITKHLKGLQDRQTVAQAAHDGR